MRKCAFFKGFGRLAVISALITVLFPCPAPGQQSFSSQTLRGNVPSAIARFHLQPLRNLAATNRLNLAISLPLKNEPALGDLLRQIYNPASTNYHHYLTPEQFTEQFGPSQQDYDAVIHFAQSNGLTITAIYPNRALVDVSGSAATIQKIFHTTLRVYRHPVENRTFFAPDTDPIVDLTVPVFHVSGLDNFTIPHPAIRIKKSANTSMAMPASGSGPFGEYIGKDFRAAYAPDVTLGGAGQSVGLLELEGYYTNDILAYEAIARLPHTTLTNVYVNGFSGEPNPSDQDGIIEVSLDIEMAISMATNLSSVAVFQMQGNGNIVDILNSIAANNAVSQISSSWLLGDNPAYEPIYQQMAMQGQSFFQASGDDGAFYPGIAEWADDTNITLVGGTTLYTSGTNIAWSSETAWNWYITLPPNTDSTGGGTNFNGIPIPDWQTNVSMVANQGSTTLRNVPDVALTADNIYVQALGQSYYVGGTSAAAPLWAAFTALMNQQGAILGQPTLGFLNPAIYALGESTNYTNYFHDITTGNNTNSTVTDNYFAVPGYDLCTGWGTPNGQSLINALVPPDALVIIPEVGFNASGPATGPFSPSSQIYTFTNSSASPLAWSLINTSSWLTVSATNSTLAPGDATNLTISLGAGVNSLPIGAYSTTLIVTDLLTGVAQSLQFKLRVAEPLVISPSAGFTATGFAGGIFTPSSQNYILTNNSLSSLTWSLINTSSWLNASSMGGTIASSNGDTVTISVNPEAESFLAGTYSATLTFTDAVFHGTQNFQFALQVIDPLVIVPTNGFMASGAAGGPFSLDYGTLAFETFSLTNVSASVMNWQAAGMPSWLDLSPSSGTLASGATATLIASINSTAYNLPPGIYPGQVSFTDEASGIIQYRQFSLSVAENFVQNGGFETGDFTDWGLSESGGTYSLVDNGSKTGMQPHSGKYFAAFGHPSTLGYIIQDVPTITNQFYLISLWLNSPDVNVITQALDQGIISNTPNEFKVQWSRMVLFDESNVPPTDGWTNILLIAPAPGTNAVLRFGERCDPWYLGLDDVSVWPIPNPNIRGFWFSSNNIVSLSWNSLTSLVYQVQYSTNLATTNWFNLNTYTASDFNLSVTNGIGTNPAAFYRVLQLP